ncbi:transferase [Knoellia flava TL1]|uniref:Citramalate synthase n=2 Tax=Knoellia flava TaxID=913969 RepID=A0A8H9FVZ3_9MICO|nr:citramalate synthase [Knoellia flava]KGN28808.1 transferase [Knoellia flava TL1]GGB85716.1 (R)-citramalate synthase [Knoellia flava]
MSDLHVYDTTLRDGAQQEGLNLSVQDKLTIASHLDELGVGFIEGGWPGANPKDTEFFARAATDLTLKNATLAAFGATRRAGGAASTDPLVRALLDSQAPVVTLVAKSHVGHVERALRTTKAENLEMIRDTVTFLRGEGRRVFVDAEHFFDGYAVDRAYAIEALRAVFESGGEVAALCDTNGGMLPGQVWDVVTDVTAALGLGSGPDGGAAGDARLGIHCHNDTGCAVANSMAAVDAGATHVQGTINGYGERTGNANLVTVVANLQLKVGQQVMEPHRLQEATRISHAISEITNVPAYSRQPYTGASAFAHKAGLHASAIKVDPDLYQHLDPKHVGNDMRMLISDMAGRASVELKAREIGIDLDPLKDEDSALVQRVLATVKDLELRGYTFDAADASFELLLRREIEGSLPDFFEVESWRVITDSQSSGAALSEATVKLTAGGRRVLRTGEGNGPVNALDHALRLALATAYPEIEHLELIDYRVRILDAAHGTDAVTRVLIETSDGETTWETIGVAANILEASWMALVESVTYGLLRAGVPAR